MQATLDCASLKPFTRALTCISKYGEETIIRASSETLSLSSINSSRSAYCNFKYNKEFFQRYSLKQHSSQINPDRAGSSRTADSAGGNDNTVICEVNTKALLSILRHRNTDKSAEKCEFIIIEGSQNPEEGTREDEDSLESRLIVRLHCKHGVVKTHRLLLNSPTDAMTPVVSEADLENRISVRPGLVKDIIDHFPFPKGAKSDPQLIWRFDIQDVSVRTVEGVMDAKGKSQLATELSIEANDFEEYDVPITPMTVGFHLREFNAAVAFAHGMAIPLELRLVAPSDPLRMSAEVDDCQVSFIISTVHVRGADEDEQRSSAQPTSNRVVSGASRKRDREDVPGRHIRPEARKSMKVVKKTDAATANAAALSRSDLSQQGTSAPDPSGSQQPLFLASQMSSTALEAIRGSGLGIEDMDAEEFAAMLDDEGEEVNHGLPPSSPIPPSDMTPVDDGQANLDGDVLEYVDSDNEDSGFGPSQLDGGFNGERKAFRPLFED